MSGKAPAKAETQSTRPACRPCIFVGLSNVSQVFSPSINTSIFAVPNRAASPMTLFVLDCRHSTRPSPMAVFVMRATQCFSAKHRHRCTADTAKKIAVPFPAEKERDAFRHITPADMLLLPKESRDEISGSFGDAPGDLHFLRGTALSGVVLGLVSLQCSQQAHPSPVLYDVN